jgi:hypothetical protein
MKKEIQDKLIESTIQYEGREWESLYSNWE